MRGGADVLEWLPHVDSPRSLALLRRLAGELRARKANSPVRGQWRGSGTNKGFSRLL
ncbi:MAG: hypothetical protein ACRDQ4_22650 [Pseudonocardiaceae bacterium]